MRVNFLRKSQIYFHKANTHTHSNLLNDCWIFEKKISTFKKVFSIKYFFLLFSIFIKHLKREHFWKLFLFCFWFYIMLQICFNGTITANKFFLSETIGYNKPLSVSILVLFHLMSGQIWAFFINNIKHKHQRDWYWYLVKHKPKYKFSFFK